MKAFIRKQKYQHLCSWRAIDSFLKFASTHGREVQELAETGDLRSLQTLRNEIEADLPHVFMDTCQIIQRRGVTRRVRVSRATRLKKVLHDKNNPNCRYEVIKTYVLLKDLVEFVKGRRGHENLLLEKVDVSVDGVEESRRGEYSFLIVSIAFYPCHTVYVWQVYRHLLQARPDIDEVYGSIRREILGEGLVLVRLPADGKERKLARGMTATGSYWSCEFCLAPGNAIPDKDDATDTRPKVAGIFYSSKYQHCEERTPANLELLVQEVEAAASSTQKKPNHVKGVKQRSPLMNMPGFDVIWGLPYDSLHQLDVGIVKKLIEAFFFDSNAESVREQRGQLQNLVSAICLPTEHGRRTKSLGEKTKSKEYKAIALFALIPIAREIFSISKDSSTEGEQAFVTRMSLIQRVFLRLAFIYRALFVTDGRLAEVEQQTDVQHHLHMFQQEFEALKGEQHSHFNMHCLMHALQSRKRTGPLWQTSTERFENAYGDARRMYTKGTMSTGKQIIVNLLAKDVDSHHCAEKKRLHFNDTANQKTDDTLMWIGNECYKIEKMLPGGYVRCRKMEKYLFCTADVQLDAPWHTVGVYLRGEVENKRQTLHTSCATGKGVIVDHTYLFKYDSEWLI